MNTFNPFKTFFKSLALAVVAGAIGFFAGNFLGIISLGIYSLFTHVTPDFTLAYRRGGVPLAIVVFFIAFIVAIVRDVRASLSDQSQ